MKSRHILIAVALVLTAEGAVWANFALTGSEHMNVTTSHTTGVLFDVSTADVLAGGYIKNAYVNDEAFLRVMRPSGSAIYTAWAYNSGRIAISRGDVSLLSAYETSSVDISGGGVFLLNAYDASSVDMSGGTVSLCLYAHNASSVDMSGGTVSLCLYAHNTSSVAISGGTVFSPLCAYGASSVDISGGSVFWLLALDTSNITLHGYDFQATGGLSLIGDEVIGTGLLTGKWFDGTAWAIVIHANDATATILAIPEPASAMLLGFGAMFLARRRKQARQV